MASHKSIALGQIHKPYNWEYADAATRVADTSVLAADLGKFARQTDDDTIWMLTATTPTWSAVSASASASSYVYPPPATLSDAGIAGQYSADAFYFYFCYATNAWGKIPLQTS